jgi:hypothetical protein
VIVRLNTCPRNFIMERRKHAAKGEEKFLDLSTLGQHNDACPILRSKDSSSACKSLA